MPSWNTVKGTEIKKETNWMFFEGFGNDYKGLSDYSLSISREIPGK